MREEKEKSGMSHFARSVRSAAGWLVDICAGRESIHHNSKVELWVDVAAAAAGLVSLRRPIRA